MQKYQTFGYDSFEFKVGKSADLIKVDPKTKSIELKFSTCYRKDVEKKFVVMNFNLDIIAEYNPRNLDDIPYLRKTINTSDCFKIRFYTNGGRMKMGDFYNLGAFAFKSLEPYKDLEEDGYCHFNDYVFHIFRGGQVYIISDSRGYIIDAIIEPDYSLQLGDDQTQVWLINNMHILVWNDGDVSSVVAIKCIDVQTKKREFERKYEHVKDMSDPFNGESVYDFV